MVEVLCVVHWLLVLISGKRNKDLAMFMEYWNTEVYRFIRYTTGVTNERPFPFTDMRRISKFVK